MNQEIIELLEKRHKMAIETCGERYVYLAIEEAEEILTFLKQLKCKTCIGCEHLKNPQGGYCYMFKEKPKNCRLNTSPDCQQPPASEFTNDVKFVVTALKHCKKINPKNPLAVAEAIPDLLATCKAMKLRIPFIGLPSEPMNENGPDWSKEIALLEVALAKAKKEG